MPGQTVAARVHDLINLDVPGRGGLDALERGVTEQQGDNHADRAATLLRESVDPGDTVVVLTGFLEPPAMIQETDGPLGAIVLSRALVNGLDANVVLATERQAVAVCEAVARAAHMNPVERKHNEMTDSVTVETFPADRDAARSYAMDLLGLDPAAIVAVEKTGVNSAGEYHNMAGQNISEHTAKVSELFAEATDVPVVAVGDGGNEIGMGSIAETVRKHIDHGDMCRCDCGEGIADTVQSDALVTAAVSNWGAYGIVTCLEVQLESPLLHTPAVERDMLRAASQVGAVDGSTGKPDAWCDGMETDTQTAIVQLLHQITQSLPDYHAVS